MDIYLEALRKLDYKITNSPYITKIEEDCFIFGAEPQNAQKLISICIHGNEIIGLPILEQLLSEADPQKISFGFLIGNRKSIEINQRFTQKDLNRSFSYSGESKSIYEISRAKIISNFSKRFQYIFDIHQTTAACEKPFFIVRDTDKVFNFTCFLMDRFPDMEIVLSAKLGFSKDGQTFSEFAQSEDIYFVTLELGEKGINQDLTFRGVQMCQYFLENDVLSNETQLNTFKIIGNIQKNNPKDHLLPGLKNLSRIFTGQLLSKSNNTESFAKEDAFVLFPKYGVYQEQASELCQILKPYLWSR